jgi:hypothetical protein
LWVGPMLAEASGQKAARPDQPVAISAESFRKKSAVLIGDLGYPLGTPLEIDATIVSEMDHFETPTGHFLLKVTRVNEKELNPSVLMRFGVRPGLRNALVENEGQFDELCGFLRQPGNFLNSKPLSEEEIKTFERNYVGSRHKLSVYEAAHFEGVPEKLPSGKNAWNGPTFGLYTTVAVVLERKP